MSAKEDDKTIREAYIRGAKDKLQQVCDSADDGGYQTVGVDLLRELLQEMERGEWPKETPCQTP